MKNAERIALGMVLWTRGKEPPRSLDARARRAGIRARPSTAQDIRRYAANVGVDLEGVPKQMKATIDAIRRCEHARTLHQSWPVFRVVISSGNLCSTGPLWSKNNASLDYSCRSITIGGGAGAATDGFFIRAGQFLFCLSRAGHRQTGHYLSD